MKTYKFFYFDSREKQSNFDVKTFVVNSSRFDSAFSSFSHFLASHKSDFVDFMDSYVVHNGFKNQCRSISDFNHSCLSAVRDRHNAISEEVSNEN